MQLHRSSSQPDWAAISPDNYNKWQQTAARTHSILTPGNVLTIAGFLLVLSGLWLLQVHDYWWGLAVMAVGRLFDILDGLVADHTATKSSLGEKLDAGFDKLASVAAFILLVTAHIIVLPVAVLLLVPNLTNATLTILANHRGLVLHPSNFGKLAMATSWIALSAFVLVVCLHYTHHSWLYWLGDVLVAVALLLGALAGMQYARFVRNQR